jgi:hypothetical protein
MRLRAGQRTVADAILDRLLHHCHKIEQAEGMGQSLASSGQQAVCRAQRAWRMAQSAERIAHSEGAVCSVDALAIVMC